MLITPQTLNINNLRTTSAKSISLHTIRKLIEYYFKNLSVKAMLTLTILVSDSILKHAEGWRLNKRKSTVSIRSIPGASTNGMAHQVKGCLVDIFFSIWVFFHDHSQFTGLQGKGGRAFL